MIGQISLDITQKFNATAQVKGFVLIKLDGDASGGIALIVTAITQKSIKFISSGENIKDIEFFYADRVTNPIWLKPVLFL